jgi:pantoate kinase
VRQPSQSFFQPAWPSFPSFRYCARKSRRRREGGHRAVDAAFAQQVQHRVGRTIGVVGDIVRVAAGKFVLRMQAGDLEDAVVTVVADQRLGLGEEEVIVQKSVIASG